MNMRFKILLIVGGLALTCFGYIAGMKLNEKPQEDKVTHEQCVRSCSAINSLMLSRLVDAKRVTESEMVLLDKQAAQACNYACEKVKDF